MSRSERLQLRTDAADERFDSAWLKLDRARTHLDWLRDAETEFRLSKPVLMRTTTEPDDDGSIVYRIVASVTAEPAATWAPVIGDVVHNARSALDHAVWAISHVQHQATSQMPICDSETAWEAECPRRLAGVMEFQRAHIRQYQPFNHDEPATAPLSVLRELSNRDKHRAVHAVALVSEEEWVGATNAVVTFEHLAHIIPFRDQEEVMRVRAVPEDPTMPMEVHPRSACEISIVGTYAGMLDILDSACWFAERLVRRLERPSSRW